MIKVVGPGVRGFTLIEVLIAMAATLLIVSVAFATFSNLISGMETLRRGGSEATDINRAWMLLGRDLRQFIDRPVRDEYGTVEAGMTGGELADDSLSFSRAGWHNPNQQPRSNIQRVRYELEDEILWRANYTVLDRTDVNEPARVELLRGVERFELAFLGAGSELPQRNDGGFDTTDWPRSWGIDPTGTATEPPPQAVLVILELKGLGEIERLFELPYD